MPRLSVAHVAIVAVLALVALPRAAIPLIDGDVWWHIRAGLDLLETGRVSTVDTWSIAGAGMPWTSQDWLSNVVLAWITGGATEGGMGATFASFLFALLVVIATLLLFMALAARGLTGWFGGVVWLTFGLLVAGPVLGVRVQVIDLTLAAGSLVLLWRYLAQPRRVWLIGLPILAVLWANLHAGWVLLFLLGGAVIVGEVVDGALHRGEPLRGRALGELCLALIVAAAAISVNPNGPALYLYPLETSLIGAHREYLAEWAPPAIGSIVGQLFWGFVVFGVVPAIVLGWRHLRTADLLILVGLTFMAATAARFLLVAPIIGAVVALAWARVPAPVVLERMLRAPRSAGQGGLNLALAVAVVAVGVTVAFARVGPSVQRDAIREHMPVEAVDWMLANEPGERVFNTYAWGGYLGLRRPELPVFIDGRSDVYGDTPIREYARAVLLERDPADLFEGHGVDHILFGVDTPLAEWLDGRPEWERVYADDLAAIWVRAGERLRAVAPKEDRHRIAVSLAPAGDLGGAIDQRRFWGQEDRISAVRVEQ
jgi:hypothetical protein